MYSEDFLEKVKDQVEIVDLISRYSALKPSGRNYSGLSCFSDEKTPSLIVFPDKQRFSCYSSGISGDAIDFIKQVEGLTFPDAVEFLTELYSIEPEKRNTEMDAKYEEQKRTRSLLQQAHNKYKEIWQSLDPDHWAKRDIINRGLPENIAIDWQLGFAPEGRVLCDTLVPNGLMSEGEKAGLVTQRDERNNDFFYNRQLIPIHDALGRLVGFAGRAAKGGEPKYLNPRESEIYHKSQILFGLNRAAKDIRKLGQAILVEGYWDVIALHHYGITNAVATCGTGFNQSKVLKKYTNQVLILFDGDKAGIKATHRIISECLNAGLIPQVCFLPDGLDPCDFCSQEKEKEKIDSFIKANTGDGIMWKAGQLLEETSENPFKNGEAVIQIADMIFQINNDQTREKYLQILNKSYKVKPEIFRKRFKELEKQEKETENSYPENQYFPEYVDKDEALKYGFYEGRGNQFGYWFFNNHGKADSLTNFTVTPLYHIYSKEDSKRMIEINNGELKRILELPSKTFTSLEQFTTAMFDEGNFLTKSGFTKNHLQKILSKISPEFPICYELKTLGWQPEGFFAYNNMIFNGTLKKFDQRGIVEHKGINYFSPSASNIQDLERRDNDAYENDRSLSWTETKISFEEWCHQILTVYNEKGGLAIAYTIVSLFRDLFFNLEGCCPHLYCYGPVQSGKSVFALSVSNLFFQQLKPFNLNQGTDFAFFNRLERFRNCPVVLNEFDDDAVKEEWFRALKAFYDGEGRERGKNKHKSETQKVNCTVILTGQKLSTKDDSSVLTRCITIPFTQENERSQNKKEEFAKLKEWESNGLSGILASLLTFRHELAKDLPDEYSQVKKKICEAIKADGNSYKDRIVNNYSYLITALKKFSQWFNMGISADEFFVYCKNEIVRLSNLINESNALADFWKTVEFLLDSNQITEGFDFKIEIQNSVTVKENGREKSVIFSASKKLLYIRLNFIHKRYLEAHRKQYARSGMNEQTLLHYIKDEESYIGNNSSSRFKKNNINSITSSFVFDYDQLCRKVDFSLERSSEDFRSWNSNTEADKPDTDDLPF